MSENTNSYSDVSDGIPSFAVPELISDACRKAKAKERESLMSDVERFLASGGQIEYVDPNVMTDPPKKPVSNYGSQPI